MGFFLIIEHNKLRSSNQAKMKQQELTYTRVTLFVASIVPMLVWIFSGHVIANPAQVWCWALLCGLLAATTPAILFKGVLLLQVCALPLTFGWIGAISVTGFGPSNAAFEAAQFGPLNELKVALNLALTHPSFVFTTVIYGAILLIACYLAWSKPPRRSSRSDLIFLLALTPLALINLDGFGSSKWTRLAGPEARLSVPWLYQIELGKSLVTRAADQAGRIARGNADIREAKSAPKQFTMDNGLAIFVLSDSTRSDVFIQPHRGIWSRNLQDRLDNDLGMRFNDACSGGSSTSNSVPRLLTAADIDDLKGINQNHTILATVKAAGARTAYINNHEMWIVPESGHDFTQRTTAIEKQAFDDVAVEVLADFIKKSPKGPKAALLHLYGQHFLYEERYPRDAFPEVPNNLSAAELSELHYMRAVEYGNKVLLDLAAILDQRMEPAFAIFTSDHGENLPSDKTGKKYHALPSSGKFDTTVPALVLWNKAFKDAGKPALLEPLKNKNGLIAHQDLAKAWLILAGMPGQIKATENPSTWGALNPGEKSRKILCSDLHP